MSKSPDESAGRVRQRAAEVAARWVAGLETKQRAEEDGGERDRPAEQDLKESRRSTPMSFALRADLKERLSRFRSEGRTINVSDISNKAIERELDRIESGNAVAERLRVELTERRGPSWTIGYQTGRKWAEEVASWLEITGYATRYTDLDVKVEVLDAGFGKWAEYLGTFRAPERDYGRDTQEDGGAPAFITTGDDQEPRWEHRIWELEAYWRAWLHAVREVYEDNKAHLPSVIERVPAPDESRPRDVDPDDIPF
jgi:hypothetical protein